MALHTTYLVVRQCTLAPRISRTDRSNELRLVPRPPDVASGHTKLTVGAPVAQPMGRDNGSSYLVVRMCTAPRFLEPTVAMSSD
jgi:hypothetical protein